MSSLSRKARKAAYAQHDRHARLLLRTFQTNRDSILDNNRFSTPGEEEAEKEDGAEDAGDAGGQEGER